MTFYKRQQLKWIPCCDVITIDSGSYFKLPSLNVIFIEHRSHRVLLLNISTRFKSDQLEILCIALEILKDLFKKSKEETDIGDLLPGSKNSNNSNKRPMTSNSRAEASPVKKTKMEKDASPMKEQRSPKKEQREVSKSPSHVFLLFVSHSFLHSVYQCSSRIQVESYLLRCPYQKLPFIKNGFY